MILPLLLCSLVPSAPAPLPKAPAPPRVERPLTVLGDWMMEWGSQKAPVTFGLGGQFQNSLDVGEFEPAEVAFYLGNGTANQATAHGGREFG